MAVPGPPAWGPEAPSPQRPTLMGKLREELAVRHDARRSVKSYVLWVRRYLVFHGYRHPREMGAGEIHAFLSHLATDRGRYCRRLWWSPYATI